MPNLFQNKNDMRFKKKKNANITKSALERFADGLLTSFVGGFNNFTI